MYGAKIGGIIVVMATGFTFNFLYFSISLLDEEDRRAQKNRNNSFKNGKKVIFRVKGQSTLTKFFSKSKVEVR